MNAAIYARYSDELQSPTSIEDQVRLCRRYADAHGYTVAPSHVLTDYELTGAIKQRPGYLRLLEMTEERPRPFDVILVELQNRLWRNQAETHHALERLQFRRIRVIVVITDTELTGRTGGVIATVNGLTDQLFLANLADQTRRGMEGAIRRGYSAGGRAYGYRSEPIIEGGKFTGARRVIVQSEAENVVRACELYVAGFTARGLAHTFNEDRVRPLPRGAHGRVTGSWTPATFIGAADRALGILRNPMYAGRIVWNRSQKVLNPDTGKRVMRPRPQSEWVWKDAPELRIIADDLWQQVQARLQQRAWKTGAWEGARPKHLLSGTLVCGECQANYVIQQHRPNVQHYGCAAHRDRGGSVCSNDRLVRRDSIENKVVNYMLHDLFAPDKIAYLHQAVEAAIERRSKDAVDASVRRARGLAEARRELENVANAIRSGIITPTTKAMLEEAENRVATLERDTRETLRQPVPAPSVSSAVDRYLRDLRGTLETNVDAARRMLALAVEKIVLVRDGPRLMAEVRGNMVGLLEISGCVSSVGAGRGI